MEKDRKSKGKKAIDSEGGEDVKPEDKEFLELVRWWYLPFCPSWLKQWLDKPDGSPATIKFIEVGGRTTALVEELQKMPAGIEIKPKISKGGKGAGAKRKKAIKEEDSVSSSDHDHMTKC